MRKRYTATRRSISRNTAQILEVEIFLHTENLIFGHSKKNFTASESFRRVEVIHSVLRLNGKIETYLLKSPKVVLKSFIVGQKSSEILYVFLKRINQFVKTLELTM